ncbi:hypothetical protein A2875_03170 [Candidatus Gottesmanbacteria bacterium RIFCSPHIGHO2_01_FULL_46_14]|nr:MAG: hypothetical protein A2875_03170 [Candidatus Gottesmanbacteria bacterium RIFCSPHIGHO2_01_FULL_46_14]
MCNVNPGSCSTPEQWVTGWYEARQPENIDKPPQQPEYTQRNESNDSSQPPDRPVEIIRLAGERNNVNRSDIAAIDAKNRGGDLINGERNADRIQLDKNLRPVTSGTSPFGNNSGIHTSKGKDCDDYLGTTSDTGASGLECHGQVTINVCKDGPTGRGPGPICINSVETRSGNVDCVSIANQYCAFVQLDTPNGSGMTCYPTNCAAAPTASTPPGTSQPPPPGGETNPPPSGENTPTPTHRPGGQCQAIRVYDASDTNITEALRNGTRRLSAGETVTLATPRGTATTKARFRIQGITQFAENNPALTTNNEYRLAINIPSAITQAQASFEAEVFINGNWK